MLYRISIFICKIMIFIFFRFRVEGAENLPQDKGFILAANHRTNYDPLLVAIPPRQQVFFMAKAELFKKGLVDKFLRAVGAFPIQRGKGDTGAIDWAVQVLRGGGVLGMFPEGTRNSGSMPGKPKSGAAMIAYQTHADVIPCAVCYGEKLSFRAVITMKYGKAITFEDLGFSQGEISPHEIKEASRMIMGKIIKLLEESGCLELQ